MLMVLAEVNRAATEAPLYKVKEPPYTSMC
jgi:hypothetical protein